MRGRRPAGLAQMLVERSLCAVEPVEGSAKHRHHYLVCPLVVAGATDAADGQRHRPALSQRERSGRRPYVERVNARHLVGWRQPRDAFEALQLLGRSGLRGQPCTCL